MSQRKDNEPEDEEISSIVKETKKEVKETKKEVDARIKANQRKLSENFGKRPENKEQVAAIGKENANLLKEIAADKKILEDLINNEKRFRPLAPEPSIFSDTPPKVHKPVARKPVPGNVNQIQKPGKK